MMIKASWFGEAEISNEGMRNLVGNQLFDDFQAAMKNVRDLYGTGDDLRNIISDMAPSRGVNADELARLAHAQSIIHTIKDKAKENGIPVKLGYMCSGVKTGMHTVWYIDTEAFGEVMEIKLTAFGRKATMLLGGIEKVGFNTEVKKGLF